MESKPEEGDSALWFVHDLNYSELVLTITAVKCNPDPEVIRLLAALGTGFDCASKAEIENVLQLGIDPSRIIYANPCKTKSHVQYARQKAVKQMTFDSTDELYKIKALFSDAELFLRILTDDSSSLCKLSIKFGACPAYAKELLRLAKQLDLNVVGVSFHVGSGGTSPSAFLKAVQDSRTVFDNAAEVGYNLKALDIGGGFLEAHTFEEMARVLSSALDRYFPPDVNVIGEPGHYYVSSAFTLACSIIARKKSSDDSYMLYLNNGIYGNFLNHLLRRERYYPCALSSKNFREDERPTQKRYSIWGPTLDGEDCIAESLVFLGSLDVGDWLYFKSMGAYTISCSTNFNGFSGAKKFIYVSSEPAVSVLLSTNQNTHE